MGRAFRAGAAVAGAAAGIAAGYLAERAVVRPRIVAPAAGRVPLGSLGGETRRVHGPDGTDLLVESYGPPDAPQVVLAHGFTCTGRVWHEQVLGLSDRYRLITYDQPGHGRSSAPRSGELSIPLCGDALAAVVADATRPGPLVLAGHSLGGMTVLDAVHRHPDVARRAAGLVLLSTTSRARPEEVSLELGIHAAARFERGVRRIVPWLRTSGAGAAAARGYQVSSDLSFLATRALAVGPDADPRVVEFTEQLVLDSDPDTILGLLSPILAVDLDAALTCTEVPTTIVTGARDRLTPPSLSRRMAERCANSRLVELPGVGHMSPLEAPAEVSALLAQHLARVGAAGSTPRAVAAGQEPR